jgi:hypothetical protein
MISEIDFHRQPQPRELRGKWIAMIICAALLVGLHVLLPVTAAPLSQAEPSFAGEIFPWVSVPTGESLNLLQAAAGQWRTCVPFVLVCIGLFAVYANMFRMLRGVQSLAVQAFVFAAGAVALLSYAVSPVMFSSDIFAYAMYGRATSVYGGNPYSATMPFPDTDPFYIQFGQEYLPSWYGPVWTFISAGVTWCTGANLGVTVLVFRLIAIVCALITSGFIWSCLRKYSPDNAARGLVLFLWNPLLVMETGLSGHNDPVMLALVVCGVWLHLRGHKAAAVMALTLSALVKFLTGMLVPLYMLLVLRESKTWRERISFVLRSAVPAGAVALAMFHFAKADTDVPVAHSATAPDFYMNNFHELIFKRLRVAVGEDAESANVSVFYYPYWLRLREGTPLRSAKSASAAVLRHAETGEQLLLVAPEKREWPRVYDPVTHQKGWFIGAGFDESKRPALADSDPVARELEKPVMEQQTVRKANAILRIVTWLGFAAFGLFAAWRTRSFMEFLVWSGASLLASYFFIITEIWPWYVNWALALGALAPGRMPARLAMLLSAGVLTLYITLGLEGSKPAWMFPLRSLLAFVLPLLIFAALWFLRWRNPAPDVRIS